ncbi:LysR family transcriptional regulator [Alkalibaculum sporogenes]|nr:LysR family transcriptional regulator [Alkalibaculum sporogenes]
MELKQLTYFIQITEDKSFSKAAKHLFVTQQALSKAISNLEEELDVPLFNRTYSGLELTQYGTILHKRAKNIINQSVETFDEIKKSKLNFDRKVTIVVSYGLIQELSTNILPKFRNLYPDIELTIRDHPDLICEHIILDSQSDLGCVVGPVDDDLFESTLLLSDDLYMLINKNNYISQIDSLTINHLKNQDYVLPTDDFRISNIFKSYCKSNGFTPNVNFVSNEISFLQRMVHFNEGITILPRHDVPQLVYSNIIPVKFPDRLNLQIYLVRRKNETYSVGCNTLWNFLTSHSQTT